MLSHAPPGYECPFCALVAGGDTELNAQSDVVWRDARTTRSSHVFARRAGDDLYGGDADVRWTTPEERAPYAARLTAALGADGPAGG